MSGDATRRDGAGTGPMTMAELARLAGVSASTVSRALAGNPAIHSDTRARILALAKAQGFTPNGLARSLRLGRTGSLGIMLPAGIPDDAAAASRTVAMIAALAEAAAVAGHDVLMWREAPADAGDPAGDACADTVADGGASAARTGRADGIVVVGDAAVPAGRQPVVRWTPTSALAEPADVDDTAKALVADLMARVARRETRTA